MIKYVAVVAVALVVGLGGGLGLLLFFKGRGVSPPKVEISVTGFSQAETPAPSEEGPLFYNVQTWYEFAQPAGADALAEAAADAATGVQILPPKGMEVVSPDELERRAGQRSSSNLLLGDAGFDPDSVVWLFESEDGKSSLIVRSKPSPSGLDPKNYEELLSRYSEQLQSLLGSLNARDVHVEAAFFQGGLGLYSKFVNPGPPDQMVHSVQVLGLPNGRIVTVTFSTAADAMPPDWEAIVQASIDSLKLEGQLVQ